MLHDAVSGPVEKLRHKPGNSLSLLCTGYIRSEAEQTVTVLGNLEGG